MNDEIITMTLIMIMTFHRLYLIELKLEALDMDMEEESGNDDVNGNVSQRLVHILKDYCPKLYLFKMIFVQKDVVKTDSFECLKKPNSYEFSILRMMCYKCRRRFKTEAGLTQHKERTGCAAARQPSKRRVTQPLAKLVQRKDTVSEVMAGLTCSYSKFVMAKSMNTYLDKIYPLLFTVDDSATITRSQTAWKDILAVLNDARCHGSHFIEIEKFYGESLYIYRSLLVFLVISCSIHKHCSALRFCRNSNTL